MWADLRTPLSFLYENQYQHTPGNLQREFFCQASVYTDLYTSLNSTDQSQGSICKLNYQVLARTAAAAANFF